MKFDEDYFLRGKETGVSNFENYRWLPDQTIALAWNLRRYLALKDDDSILDFGCARGFLCKAMRKIGVQAWGYDISDWAIQNCDEDVKPFVSNHLNGSSYSAIVSKDTLEHIPLEDLRGLLRWMSGASSKLFFILPLAKKTGGEYVHPKEELDATHVNRFTLTDWMLLFQDCLPSYVVNASYFYPGLKPGALEVEQGYGFFLCTRL